MDAAHFRKQLSELAEEQYGIQNPNPSIHALIHLLHLLVLHGVTGAQSLLQKLWAQGRDAKPLQCTYPIHTHIHTY